MKSLLFVLLIITVVSCKEQDGQVRKNERDTTKPVLESAESKPINTQTFSSEKWGVGFKYPDNFEVYEGELAPNTPVINIYPSSAGITPPFGIHEEAEITYIAFIPNGFGVDGPSGKRISLQNWEGNLPLTFNIDEGNSTVYLLENNEPWGFLLKFHQAPGNWSSQGSIFIRFGVKDFNAICEEKEGGREIPMEQCDPLAGDVIKLYGNIQQEERRALIETLMSLTFFSPGKEQESLDNLIKVEEPRPNLEVSSPLTIKGKAKGYWFFEAEAPVALVDKNYKSLGRGSITTIGDWMTEDFVTFEGSLEFKKPSVNKGYLIFRKANASGMPEHDRGLLIPVIFK